MRSITSRLLKTMGSDCALEWVGGTCPSADAASIRDSPFASLGATTSITWIFSRWTRFVPLVIVSCPVCRLLFDLFLSDLQGRPSLALMFKEGREGGGLTITAIEFDTDNILGAVPNICTQSESLK